MRLVFFGAYSCEVSLSGTSFSLDVRLFAEFWPPLGLRLAWQGREVCPVEEICDPGHGRLPPEVVAEAGGALGVMREKALFLGAVLGAW